MDKGVTSWGIVGAPVTTHVQLDRRQGGAPTGGSSQVSSVGEGLRLYNEGHISEALWEFFEAVSHDPTDPLNHYLSGLALRALGLKEEAHAEWREVLTLMLRRAVLARTIGAEAAPDPRSQWAHGMAQCLLQQDTAAEGQQFEMVLEDKRHV